MTDLDRKTPGTDGLADPPAEVVAAAEAGERPAEAGVGVLVADPQAAGDATLANGGYEGPDAVACGYLTAALSVAESTDCICLHHGDVDLTAPGPWLVLAPLSGHVATVATGTATATVTVPLDDGGRIQPVRERLDALLSAARTRHDDYPVADDGGVFRTGMTTCTLDEVMVDESLRVRFDVSTTPTTTRGDLVERFESAVVDADVDVTFDVGVERAAPGVDLRDAVEDAHRAVVGDAAYEWLPRPTAFSRIPGGQKVAFGAGRPGDRFDHGAFERTRDLLRHVVSNLEVCG